MPSGDQAWTQFPEVGRDPRRLAAPGGDLPDRPGGEGQRLAVGGDGVIDVDPARRAGRDRRGRAARDGQAPELAAAVDDQAGAVGRPLRRRVSVRGVEDDLRRGAVDIDDRDPTPGRLPADPPVSAAGDSVARSGTKAASSEARLPCNMAGRLSGWERSTRPADYRMAMLRRERCWSDSIEGPGIESSACESIGMPGSSGRTMPGPVR